MYKLLAAYSFLYSLWIKRNPWDIISSILVFSADSLLFPSSLASGLGLALPGNDLEMEDIYKQLNIAVLRGSNMSFWLLHPAYIRSYQEVTFGYSECAEEGLYSKVCCTERQTCFHASGQPVVSKETNSSKKQKETLYAPLWL